MRLKAHVAIERQASFIAMFHFQVKRVNPPQTSLLASRNSLETAIIC
ncbi:MAG TPA: hypothetical protein VFB60_02670 [Ktedonobacteraceae bacterium]|nr:hypothetical protein [Ktedonobacteraceae bacterium]